MYKVKFETLSAGTKFRTKSDTFFYIRTECNVTDRLDGAIGNAISSDGAVCFFACDDEVTPISLQITGIAKNTG